MPIIPKLNLKAAVRINDETLSSVVPQLPSTSPSSSATDATSADNVSESIVIESQPCDVKPPFSGDEQSPPPTRPSIDEYEFEDEEQESGFKSPPPGLLNNQFRVLLTEGDDAHQFEDSKGEHAEHDISPSDHVDGSLHSFSDAESISEHSVHSDTSYTKEALQIVNTRKNLHHHQEQSNQSGTFSEPQSPSNSAVSELPPRKRRRAINKLTQDPAKLPLCDLLFYNPPLTIFQSKAQEDLNNNDSNSKEESALSKKMPLKKRASRANSAASQASNRSRRSSIDIDDLNVKSNDENSEKDNPATNGTASDEPILMLDESGNIVIKNPNSLNSNKDKKPEAKMKSSTTYNSFRRRERSKNIWSTEETGMFYTALEIVGTDFSLMEAVFFKERGRNRKQLKQKFKREEKMNREYIDSILYKSLRNRSKLNSNLLQAAAVGVAAGGDVPASNLDDTEPAILPPVVDTLEASIVLQSV